MGVLKNVAFQSLRRLKEWRETSDAKGFEDEWINNVLMPGMEKHFKKGNPTIRVCDHIEMTEETQYVDVHFELEGADGVMYQPWLLSFVTPQHVATEEETCLNYGMEVPNYHHLPEIPSPFPPYDIVWECDHFTPETVVEAMEAWSAACWPDFHPTFRYEAADDGMGWLKEVIRDALDAGELEELPQESRIKLEGFTDSKPHLIGPPEHLSLEVVQWLEASGYGPMYETTEGVIIQCTPQFSDLVQKTWSGISCEPAFRSNKEGS